MIKNCAAQGFHYINLFISNVLDLIQKRAPARSVQLEAVYLEALLYVLFPVGSNIRSPKFWDLETLQVPGGPIQIQNPNLGHMSLPMLRFPYLRRGQIWFRAAN